MSEVTERKCKITDVSPCSGSSELVIPVGPDGKVDAEMNSAVALSEYVRVQNTFLQSLQGTQFKYGEHSAQWLRLYLPQEQDQINYIHPVMVIIHGGFFKNKWHADNTQTCSLVRYFLRRGWAVVIVEYRRRDMEGGGFPGTEQDVTAAILHLETLKDDYSLDLFCVVLLGHSAGALLALRACEPVRRRGGIDGPCIQLCVAIAGFPDLIAAHDANLSDEGDAIERYMGFPPDTEERKNAYVAASASCFGVRAHFLHITGSCDVDVPSYLSEEYCRRLGDNQTEFYCIYGADHYQLVTDDHWAWLEVSRKITAILAKDCGIDLPLNPGDYGITRELGFLPSSDPVNSLISGKTEDTNPQSTHPETVKPIVDAEGHLLFSAWEECASGLSSMLCAGSVRKKLESLPLPKSDKNNNECLPMWQLFLAESQARIERAYLLLSFFGHAYVWGESPVSQYLPESIAIPWVAIARLARRQPILTYYSFNACNWCRLDGSKHVVLQNTCRMLNFFGGKDEEWFSAIHVAIEAKAGVALIAAIQMHRMFCRNWYFNLSGDDASQVEQHLITISNTTYDMVSLLQRMKENCDEYIYYHRVRHFMRGWTDAEIPNGMTYRGVYNDNGEYRVEKYYGETGAQSSVIPALDAALGVAMSADELSPYLSEMRKYMPVQHVDFLTALEQGRSIRKFITDGKEKADLSKVAAAYNLCIEALFQFRSVHLELAYRFVRQFDDRADNEIRGTGGTPFMPYLRKHKSAMQRLKFDLQSLKPEDCPNSSGSIGCPKSSESED